MTLVRFEVDISVLAPKWLPANGLGLVSQMKVLWPQIVGGSSEPHLKATRSDIFELLWSFMTTCSGLPWHPT